ncbi:NAD(P)/FAD-dependent oxidoreductase [Thalassobacillus sp. CUG 92003]|uniref:NAD(P)/FAD-dependent oxidoreductase n=1 Tax=Thalassobacillus sp. CUG 92003 TaxID=2736641 RepID=UPI0015E69790|nr:NAD(P)/FAD-dependent oxidoreductase [Thalassobacillus sp. CUG 92003]
MEHVAKYECIIVGGGIGGLQAAIQLGRYQHEVLVIDSNQGRSTICHSYHSILGWPDGVSGHKLREVGQSQARNLGVTFHQDVVVTAEKHATGFSVITEKGEYFEAERLLLATGVVDRIPFQAIYPCLGHTAFVCPDCDGYEVIDKKTMVLGSGNAGANMALALTYFTSDLVYINDEQQDISSEKKEALRHHRIPVYSKQVATVMVNGENVQGVQISNGEMLFADRAFLAYGGNEVKSQLAEQLGVKLHRNQHILVDPRTKMTDVDHVWAAGDVVAHSEQVTIAMGDGMQAAIWIHKSLLSDK